MPFNQKHPRLHDVDAEGRRIGAGSSMHSAPALAPVSAESGIAPDDEEFEDLSELEPVDINDFRRRFKALMGRKPTEEEVLDAAIRFDWMP